MNGHFFHVRKSKSKNRKKKKTESSRVSHTTTIRSKEKKMSEKALLDRILRDSISRGYFMDYCKRRYCGENLEFWIKADAYRRVESTSIARQRLAEKMLEQYVVNNSQQQIYFEADIKQAIEDAVEAGNFHDALFDDAQQIVYGYMLTDSLAKFKGSAEFQQCILRGAVTSKKANALLGFGNDESANASIEDMQLSSLDDNLGIGGSLSISSSRVNNNNNNNNSGSGSGSSSSSSSSGTFSLKKSATRRVKGRLRSRMRREGSNDAPNNQMLSVTAHSGHAGSASSNALPLSSSSQFGSSKDGAVATSKTLPSTLMNSMGSLSSSSSSSSSSSMRRKVQSARGHLGGSESSGPPSEEELARKHHMALRRSIVSRPLPDGSYLPGVPAAWRTPLKKQRSMLAFSSSSEDMFGTRQHAIADMSTNTAKSGAAVPTASASASRMARSARTRILKRQAESAPALASAADTADLSSGSGSDSPARRAVPTLGSQRSSTDLIAHFSNDLSESAQAEPLSTVYQLHADDANDNGDDAPPSSLAYQLHTNLEEEDDVEEKDEQEEEEEEINAYKLSSDVYGNTDGGLNYQLMANVSAEQLSSAVPRSNKDKPSERPLRQSSSDEPQRLNNNWNDRFQRIMDELDSLPEDQRDSTSRHHRDVNAELMYLSQDFIETAKTYGRIIIMERFLEPSAKTIAPTSMGGMAGGEKYIVQKYVIAHDRSLPSVLFN
jgi:Regulator of G protein signaling domain